MQLELVALKECAELRLASAGLASQKPIESSLQQSLQGLSQRLQRLKTDELTRGKRLHDRQGWLANVKVIY